MVSDSRDKDSRLHLADGQVSEWCLSRGRNCLSRSTSVPSCRCYSAYLPLPQARPFFRKGKLFDSHNVKVLFSSIYVDMAGDPCVIHSGVPSRTEIAAFKLGCNEANACI